MERVIVAVRRSGETRFRDLDLPAEVPIPELAQLIADALNWGQPSPGDAYRVRVLPVGRDLSPHATLLSAVVRPGSALEFSLTSQPAWTPNPPPAGPAVAEPDPAGVVKGWIPLFDPGNGPVPPQAGPAPDDPAPAPGNQGYTWKRIS